MGPGWTRTSDLPIMSLRRELRLPVGATAGATEDPETAANGEADLGADQAQRQEISEQP